MFVLYREEAPGGAPQGGGVGRLARQPVRRLVTRQVTVPTTLIYLLPTSSLYFMDLIRRKSFFSLQ